MAKTSNIAAPLKNLATDISKLQLLEGNPRRGDVDAVAASYERFGQRKPIVARKDGTVIAGNHQLMAARQLGWDQIAVVFVDDDDVTAKAFALADNRVGDLGSYDDDALVALLQEVAAGPEGLTGVGYSETDLQELLDGVIESSVLLGDPDDVPDQVPSKTVLGDVWLLGNHRLMCGDSTSPTDVERLMAGQLADMVWTDPPYGVAIVGGNHSLSPQERKKKGGLTIENDDLSPKELEQFLRSALGEANRASRAGAIWFVAAPAGPLFVPFGIVLIEFGIWRQTLVWLKNSLVMGRSDYHYRHEAIFYGWKPGAPHKAPPDRKGDTIWEFDRPSKNGEHPTMKPVQLIERAIHNHTNINDYVLDPFGGSGSTLIACEQTNRQARLMELDPHYCDVICARYEKLTGVKPISEATGNEHSFL